MSIASKAIDHEDMVARGKGFLGRLVVAVLRYRTACVRMRGLARTHVRFIRTYCFCIEAFLKPG
jgi:hypothetical protein